MFFLFGVSLDTESQLRYDADPFAFLLPEDAPETAVIMSAGFISTGLDETGGSFTPDYHEFYFTVSHRNDYYAIVFIEYRGGVWRFPEVVSFSGLYRDADPFVSACGKRLYFSSTRPIENGEAENTWNIWYVDRLDTGWSEAIPIVFDTERHERHPTVAVNGDIYFQADYGSSLVSYDFLANNIYFSRFDNGRYLKPQLIGQNIMSNFADYSPVIAPDGSFMIFASTRPGGYGSSDLYVIFKDEEGRWSPPENLGSSVNSSDSEHFPVLSPDGEYLFFATNRRIQEPLSAGRFTYSYFRRIGLGPGNGFNDIYLIGTQRFLSEDTE